MSSRSSTPDSHRSLPARIGVGRILGPHGVRGAVVIRVDSDNPHRFEEGREVVALLPGGERHLRILDARPHQGNLLARIEGVEQREEAEELKGVELEVDRDEVPPAPEGTFYFFELVGCRCRDRHEGDLGTVEEILEDGGGLLLVVRDAERRIPIPFVAGFLERVDVAKGEIDLNLPPGLVETCASTS
jgi:16S rRNA processing protein RimM